MRFFILIYDIDHSFHVLYMRIMFKMSDFWQKFNLPQSRSLSPATKARASIFNFHLTLSELDVIRSRTTLDSKPDYQITLSDLRLSHIKDLHRFIFMLGSQSSSLNIWLPLNVRWIWRYTLENDAWPKTQLPDNVKRRSIWCYTLENDAWLKTRLPDNVKRFSPLVGFTLIAYERFSSLYFYAQELKLEPQYSISILCFMLENDARLNTRLPDNVKRLLPNVGKQHQILAQRWVSDRLMLSA